MIQIVSGEYCPPHLLRQSPTYWVFKNIKTIYGQALFYDLGQGALIAVSIEGIPM